MKKLFLPFITTVFLCACSHKPPQPSGSEFQINDSKYYQQSNHNNQSDSIRKAE